MRSFALFACMLIIGAVGCGAGVPVSLSVDVDVTPEALDLIDPERPTELTLEVTMMPQDADNPPTVFTTTDTASSSFLLRLAILEQVSPCAVTGNGSAARLLFGDGAVADHAIVLSDDETSTDFSSGSQCAFSGIRRDLRVVPAVDGASVRFADEEEL